MDSSSENALLLNVPVRASLRKNTAHFSIRCYVNSKSASITLFLNFSVLMAYSVLFNITNYVKYFQSHYLIIISSIIIGAVIFFSVLAGLLTDVRYGRYKTISYTLPIIPLLFALSPLPILGDLFAHDIIGTDINFIIMSLATLYLAVLLAIIVVFITNGIQFGMDQLHDCSTQDSILYIHWYVWIHYLSVFINELPWILLNYDAVYWDYFNGLRIGGIVLGCLDYLFIFFILVISLYVIYCKKYLFFIEEHVKINPYKLLYWVIRFAWRHKTPVYRSAFTYCEDKLPSRLDLGKTKYGGPFTTEQVEDAKAFFGIFKVLLILGPVFMLQFVLEITPPIFGEHGTRYFSNDTSYRHRVHLEGIPRFVILSSGLLSHLLVVICIPLYLKLVRPYILYHIPGIMKRIGIGLLLMILSLCCALSMDMVVHMRDHDKDISCMFTFFTHRYIQVAISSNHPQVYQNIYFFVALNCLIALSNMTFDVAVLEFIASQSPYLMKGLLFGVFFAMRSSFQAIALLFIFPFSASWKIAPLSCGSGFYLMNIMIGLAVFVVYVCVAKRYKYRERDEPSKEYYYAEEYYSNIQ